MAQTANQAARLLGRLGGEARSKALTKARRIEIAKLAGSAPKKPRAKRKKDEAA